MVSGFLRISSEFDFICFCRPAIHGFWHSAGVKHSGVYFVFSAPLLYSSGGFTLNLQEALCFTTEYSKERWKCIFNQWFQELWRPQTKWTLGGSHMAILFVFLIFSSLFLMVCHKSWLQRGQISVDGPLRGKISVVTELAATKTLLYSTFV